MVASLVLLCLINAHAQDPGPPISGVNHDYDDGYVRVDVSTNAGGLTWYWGYDNSSQVPGDGYIYFHRRYVTNCTLLTDKYSLAGTTPPPPPYRGTYNGPGPLIEDLPTRSTELDYSPYLELVQLTNQVIIRWASCVTNSQTNWLLQSASELATNSMVTRTNVPTILGPYLVITQAISGGKGFFRLIAQ